MKRIGKVAVVLIVTGALFFIFVPVVPVTFVPCNYGIGCQSEVFRFSLSFHYFRCGVTYGQTHLNYGFRWVCS